MSQETAAKPKPDPKPKTIKVTVTFPISPAGPLRGERPGAETIGALREEAMTHFDVVANAQHSYYLTHAGKKIDDTHTIGVVAGTAEAVKFTLVKELVQG